MKTYLNIPRNCIDEIQDMFNIHLLLCDKTIYIWFLSEGITPRIWTYVFRYIPVNITFNPKFNEV